MRPSAAEKCREEDVGRRRYADRVPAGQNLPTASKSSTAPKSPEAPKLPAKLDRVAARSARLGAEGRYAGVHIVGADLGGADAPHVDVAQVRLESVTLSFAQMTHATVRDCVIDRGDLANLATRAATLIRVEIRGARLTGVQIVDSVLGDVVFDEAKIDLGSFRFSRFRRVLFRGCNLQRADFTGADIRGVRFTDCDLAGAQFSQVKAAGASFANCLLDGVGGVASLAGASVRASDLLALSQVFATALGIEVVTA